MTKPALTAASGDASEGAPGLWALRGLRGGRAFSVLVIAIMVTLQAMFTVAFVAVVIADLRSYCAEVHATAWWLGVIWVVYAVVTGSIARFYAWRLALIKRRLPVVEICREPGGLVLVPRHFWGMRRGRSRATEPALRSGEKSWMPVGRGDVVEVTLRRLWPTFSRADRLYRLTIESPRGNFHVTVPLGAPLLDFAAFEVVVRATGASVVWSRLDD